MRLRPLSTTPLAPIFCSRSRPQKCLRQLHQKVSASQIPSPTPFVPDAKTFLTLIGRNLAQHAAKFSSWESLFTLSSLQLRELGVEPARNRRYLLWWRDKFRKGDYGIGGDFKNVKDSMAEIRVVEVPKDTSKRSPPGLVFMRKMIVNTSPDATEQGARLRDAKPVRGLKISGARTIVGPYVSLVKGTNGGVATIKVQEGMWEERRGHKIDGGERRQKHVRHKQRQEEYRKSGK
ncbi:MAG: hypothetical protein Q9190_005149 [Brigantiaea leucoxantha]